MSSTAPPDEQTSSSLSSPSTVPVPPPFPSFAHLLSQSPSDLTALVQQLYNHACRSTDSTTQQSAVHLLSEHTALQQQLRTAEKKCVGKWILHHPPNTAASASSSTEDSMLGTLTITALTAQYVSGTLQFSLAHSFTLASRSHQQQNSKLDKDGNVHLSFRAVLAPNRALQEGLGAASKSVEGTLDLQVSGSGERMSGEFIVSEEHQEADEIEGDITSFVGVRAKQSK